MLTTDPNHPEVTRYTGPEKPAPQAKVYLVLSEEERAKGFVRPVRASYTHVGASGPANPLRDLTAKELEDYGQFGYFKFEQYPEGSHCVGKYWTKEELEKIAKGCGISTKMGVALAETYARNPNFYGATYCCTCCAHFPVDEFVWDGTDQRVGS